MKSVKLSSFWRLETYDETIVNVEKISGPYISTTIYFDKGYKKFHQDIPVQPGWHFNGASLIADYGSPYYGISEQMLWYKIPEAGLYKQVIHTYEVDEKIGEFFNEKYKNPKHLREFFGFGFFGLLFCLLNTILFTLCPMIPGKSINKFLEIINDTDEILQILNYAVPIGIFFLIISFIRLRKFRNGKFSLEKMNPNLYKIIKEACE